MDVGLLFNSSLEVGSWLTASSDNFTGSLTLSILILLGFIMLVAAWLKMPSILVWLAIVPLLIVFVGVSEFVGVGGQIIGVVILIIGFGIFALWPTK